MLKLSVALLLLATVATGCKKNPKNITPITQLPRSGMVGQDGPGGMIPPGTSIGEDRTSGINLAETGGPAEPWLNADEDRATLSAQTIYFDFDRSAVKTSEQPKADEVAAFLKNTPGVQLRVEGNCDERGTEEYNRALGERRAIAVRDYLIQKHGVESGRITTLSHGEDNPVSLGTTEEDYARNRRADFVLLKAQ